MLKAESKKLFPALCFGLLALSYLTDIQKLLYDLVEYQSYLEVKQLD